jgi:demethylmenaquinone methyltransferase/2-methoxy-6-polyprenyl-1,4-benzoquinol methylase
VGLANRIKFLLAGDVLDAINPRIPGRPHDRAAGMVGPEPGSVLDVCAGTGYLARLIARASPDATVKALDASPEMLAVGRRKARKDGLHSVRFINGDAAALPFADASLDVVVAAFGVHELPRDVRARALAEIVRALRPGGRFVAVDLDRPSRRTSAFDAYVRVFEAPYARDVLGDGLVGLLRDAGLTVTEHIASQGGPLTFQLVQARSRDQSR